MRREDAALGTMVDRIFEARPFEERVGFARSLVERVFSLPFASGPPGG